MTYPDLLTGLTPRGAVEWLHDQAAKVPQTQCIVEIGVYKARTTCWLATGARQGRGAHVYGIDPWDDPQHVPYKPKFARPEQRQLAHQHLADAGVAEQATLTQGFSTQVAAEWDHGKVGLLYIDGDHTYDGVMADWQAWRPHLVGTATVVWDDYLDPRHPGVRQAVDELAERGEITGLHVVADRIAVTRLPRGRATHTPPAQPTHSGGDTDTDGDDEDTADTDPEA